MWKWKNVLQAAIRAKHEGGEIHRGFMNIWMPVTNDDMYLTGMEVNGFL